MPTAVVSGRVDLDTKRRADMYIQQAGSTPAEVIKVVWEQIAHTGEVPISEQEREIRKQRKEAAEEFIAFVRKLPACPSIATMTDEEIDQLIRSRNV